MDTSYESEMKSGRILHIAHMLNLAVTVKSDNTIVVPDANTPTNQDVTVSRYVYSAVNIQFVTQVQDAYSIMQKNTGQIGYALAGDVEAQLATMPANFGTNVVGTLGLEPTMDDFESAWQKLDVGLAPDEDRFWWLSSAGVSAWRKLGITVNNLYTSANANALDNASVSEFLGARMVKSQYLVASGGGHQNALFQRQQCLLVRQQMPKIERDHIVGDMSDLVLGWELYVNAETQIVAEAAGAESLNDGFGVYFKGV